MVNIVKRSGKLQKFSKAKVLKGCEKAGASKKVASASANAVAKKVCEGMSTRWIGILTIAELMKRDKKAAKNYKIFFSKTWK